jgi:hypothetical protein
LETGEHLREFSLSPKAAAGILKRAEVRGRLLPDHLRRALLAVGSQAPTTRAVVI